MGVHRRQRYWSVLAVIDNQALLVQLCSKRLVWSATAAVWVAAVGTSVLFVSLTQNLNASVMHACSMHVCGCVCVCICPAEVLYQLLMCTAWQSAAQ